MLAVMANTFRILVATVACTPWILFGQANDTAEKANAGDMLLNPSTITITGHFVTSPGPTTLERALRALEQQIDQKRAAEAAQSPLESFWKNPLWKYLPSDPGGTLNSPTVSLPDRLARTPLRLDDPFCTPAYLMFAGRRLDQELALSEKRRVWFFGH
jgi:hypothetical protein